jgi:endonuclease/exonuclease/phosphatase (EEP) superfamily protein YafD
MTARLVLRLAALMMVAGAAGLLSLGYLGWLHPAFDSFSHFRLHLAAGLLLLSPLLLALKFRLEALAALVFAVSAAATTFELPGAPTPAADPAAATYRLLHMNLRFDHEEPQRALSLVGQLRPDVITLNEVSPMWQERLEPLHAAYPFRLVCPQRSTVGTVAIFSRRPFASDGERYCYQRSDFAFATIDFSGRVVDIATLHLGWPWPFGQDWQVRNLSPVTAALPGPVLLAGDFNATPWSQTVRRLAAAGRMEVVRGVGPTWLIQSMPDIVRRFAGLPIDNVMVRGGVAIHSARTVDGTGSDHLPVLVEFSVRPQRRPVEVLQAGL